MNYISFYHLTLFKTPILSPSIMKYTWLDLMILSSILKNCKKMFQDLDQMCPKTSKGYVLSQPWLISKTSSCVLSPSHLLLITDYYYPNWIFIFLLFLFAFVNPNLQVIARSTSGREWIQHKEMLVEIST